MRRKGKRRFSGTETDIEVSMTPMIDVVFQLLIYFLVTFSAADLLSFLDISRPAPEVGKSESPPSADMIRIAVLADGFSINGRTASGEELRTLVGKLASVSKEQTVAVNCADDALHGRLIQVLDWCAENGLSNLAVMSGK